MITLVGGLVALGGFVLGALGVRTLLNFNNVRRQFEASQMAFDDTRQSFEAVKHEFEATNLQFQVTKNQFESEIALARQELDRAKAESVRISERGENAIYALTMLHIGKEQMEKNNLDAALNTLTEAFHFDSNNRAINYFLGELHTQLNRFDEAAKYLITAGAEESPDAEASFPAAKAAYAFIWRKKGDGEADPARRKDFYDRAERYYLEALRRNPKLLDIHGEAVYASLGGLYKQQNRLEDAVECYEKAITVRPKDSSYPFNNLGILYTQLKNYVRATEVFQKARDIALDKVDDRPQDFWARFDLVTACAMLDDRDGVQQHIREAYKYVLLPDPLRTFLRGITTLHEAKPTDLLAWLMQNVTAEIETRERAAKL